MAQWACLVGDPAHVASAIVIKKISESCLKCAPLFRTPGRQLERSAVGVAAFLQLISVCREPGVSNFPLNCSIVVEHAYTWLTVDVSPTVLKLLRRDVLAYDTQQFVGNFSGKAHQLLLECSFRILDKDLFHRHFPSFSFKFSEVLNSSASRRWNVLTRRYPSSRRSRRRNAEGKPQKRDQCSGGAPYRLS